VTWLNRAETKTNSFYGRPGIHKSSSLQDCVISDKFVPISQNDSPLVFAHFASIIVNVSALYRSYCSAALTVVVCISPQWW